MKYIYEAYTEKQENINGIIESNNREGAIRLLQAKGYIIINLIEESTSILNIKLFQSVPRKELVIFSRELAMLFEAQIPALRIFKILSAHTQNPYLQEILISVTSDIENGKSISKAFSKYPDVFDDFFINIVGVGEESGTLNRSFLYLADHFKRSHEVASKVKSALSYPIFVIVTFLGVMILMLVSVVPQIAAILIDAEQDLPTVTNIVLGLSDYLRNNGLTVLFWIIVIVIAFLFYRNTPGGRKTIDSIKLNTPVLGKLLRALYISQMTDNLSIMLQSGVPMLRAINSVQGIIPNVVFKEALANVEEEVKQGSQLSRALENNPVIGIGIAQLVRVGEEAGEIAKILQTVTQFYQEEVRNSVDSMISLIQPAVILLLGAGVGTILAAVLLPIYSLTGAI